MEDETAESPEEQLLKQHRKEKKDLQGTLGRDPEPPAVHVVNSGSETEESHPVVLLPSIH